ncbi:hypothetical protein BDZ91DRAFT_852239 [Kalaharituber pfeilii]|nr:hypothetical protein BDZ91DRAFT_852239 [Kalaharituber pfeilii]
MPAHELCSVIAEGQSDNFITVYIFVLIAPTTSLWTVYDEIQLTCAVRKETPCTTYGCYCTPHCNVSTTPAPTPSTNLPRLSPRPRSRPQRLQTKTYGLVIHGVALRKDLDKIRKWLESDNKELGETTGIRWLRKKTTLIDEGKKTSSVVLYLKTQREVGKVRLGGRWLRSETYEQDRGKK